MSTRQWTSDLGRSQFFRFALVFLAITGAVSILTGASTIPFGHQDFWVNRGYVWGFFFLFFVTIFPRLTLLFSSIPFGGFLWWLGFIFAPRILVALLATVSYWKENPVLVVIAWLVALGGESTEKSMLGRRRQIKSWVEVRGFGRRRTHGEGAHVRAESDGAAGSGSAKVSSRGKTVEAEYKVTD